MEITLEDIKKMNIYEKLSNITNEIKRVKKNLEVGTGVSKYKAVAEKDVLDAVKDKEYKYRIYSYPKNRKLVDSQILKKNVYDKNGDSKEVTTFYSKIETTYAFINVDNPNETIETIVFSEGIDTADKGSGKGMTYADKYALLKAYKIETGDDPDQVPSPSTDDKELSLEEAKAIVVNFGKYKGKDKTFYEVYIEDKQYLEYLINGDNPNQLVKKCYDLFENMPINKLKNLLTITKVSEKSLLEKVGKNILEDLSEDEMKIAIENLEDYKCQQEKKLKQAKQNTNNMLEQAERELGKNWWKQLLEVKIK